jgi:hypothetical protein
VPGPCAPKQAEAPLLSFNLLASFLPGGDVDHIYFASYPLYWPTLIFSRTHHSVLLAISIFFHAKSAPANNIFFSQQFN